MDRNNPDLIPRDVDCEEDEDHPDDEQFFLTTAMGGDERSQSTYRIKDEYLQGSSTVSKRTAQKAPPTEPTPKLSGSPLFSSKLPPSSASPLVRLGNLTQGGIGGEELYLGPSRQFQNRAFNNSASSETSGKYDDALSNEILSNGLEGIKIDSANQITGQISVEPTTVSSVTDPSGNIPGIDVSSVLSNMSTTATNVTSRSGNPRSILNERYQKKYHRSFTKKDFVSIRDTSKGDHNPMFTSTFVCPVSGECFLSGELVTSDSGNFMVQQNGMNWYMKKDIAEFAAAGRAEDCFCFRAGQSGRHGLLEQFCADSPFLKRSRMEEEDAISTFLDSRACDANARDRVIALMKRGREE